MKHSPGGGITKTKHWKAGRSRGKFLFPVKAPGRVFRASYTAGLRKEFTNESKAFFQSLFKTDWVIYAKRPFGGPLQVIEYLGRYTHKIAISNHRIIALNDNKVIFTIKITEKAAIKKKRRWNPLNSSGALPCTYCLKDLYVSGIMVF